MKLKNTIKDIMTAHPLSVDIDARVSEIIKLIEDHDFDHLPVLDKDGILKGIISKTDLYHNALRLSKSTSGKSYSEKLLYTTLAKEIMTKNPVVVDSRQSIDFAIELLLQDKFHALPVVENNRLVGIITSKDILESISNKEIVGIQ